MPTTAIRSLSVNKTFVAVGTSEGDVYLCGHDGKILYHAGLGGQVVHSILLSARGVQAAYCYPKAVSLRGRPREFVGSDYGVLRSVDRAR